MIGSMVFVSRGKPNPERMMEIIHDLNTETDRAVAVIGGSLVEISHTEAITEHLHRNKKVTNELFNTTGAMGAFATKIHIGMLIGIYGSAAHKELLIVKDIRNRFAHSLEVRDFKTQQIEAWTKNLKFGERYTIDNAAGSARSTVSNKGKPVGEWAWWFGVTGRDAALANPRDRFLLSVQALTYGLSIPLHVAMPTPEF